MSRRYNSSNSGNHDLFENVQDLRRRLQETEKTLYTLNVQERDVDGNRHAPSTTSNPARVPPLRLDELIGDDSVEIQHILGATSHRSDGSSPRAPNGQKQRIKHQNVRPVTYGSTQPNPQCRTVQYQQDQPGHPGNGYVDTTGASQFAHNSHQSSFQPQAGYGSPRTSKNEASHMTAVGIRANAEGYYAGGNVPVASHDRHKNERPQKMSHNGVEQSSKLHRRNDGQAERSVVGEKVGDLAYRGENRHEMDGQHRSNSIQDLYHLSGAVDQGFDRGTSQIELASARSRSFQNLSQRSALSGASDLNHQNNVSCESNFDVTSLRHKIHCLREENAKLVSQNHKLLNQLEDVGFEKKQAMEQNQDMKSDMTKQAKRMEDLEEQLICLQSGSDTHEKALRESEERCEDFQRETSELESLLSEYKTQVHSLEEQITDQDNVLKRYESERNKSLDTAEEIQRAYEEYQKRAKEKLKKLEASEGHYKEKLQFVDEQREKLMNEVESYKLQLRELTEQVRSVQDDGNIEKESRHEAEQHNLQLRSQVALLQQKCGQLEQMVRFQEGLQRENESLKVSVSEHKVRLQQCQVQIGESQAELLRLEELARSLRDNKSSGSAAYEKDLNGSYLDTLEADGQEATIAELRSRLEQKERELEQFAGNRSRVDTGQSEVQDSVKRELRLAQDKNRQAEQRVEELESLLLRLEEERATLLKKLTTQEETLSDLKISSDSLDTKLTHRSSQVVDLQKELDEKLQEINRLEREIRKKTSQMSSLERQLDSKVTEVSDQVTKVSDLEEEVQSKSTQLQQLKSSLEEKSRELVQSTSMAQKLKSIHVEQCKELEKQIELLEKRFQEKEAFLKEQGGMIEKLRNELMMKDSILNEAIRKAQMEVEKKCLESDSALRVFEKKSEEATMRVKQLESALVVCKEELNVYVEQYQETKASHELEISDKEQKICQLEHQLSQTQSLLREKEAELVELESSVKGRLEMVEQSTARITELEDGHTDIQKQLSGLEQELASEKSRSEGERLTLEREVKVTESKLQQACVEVESKNLEIQQLLDNVSELEVEKEALSEEVCELERQLGQERTDSDAKLTQIDELHAQLRQLRAHVKDRDEKIEDLSESLKGQKRDLSEKSSEISRLNGEIRQMKSAHQLLSNQYAESQQEVDAVNLELGDKHRILEEHRLTIRRREDEARSTAREMETLERALEERNWELKQRAAQLSQIDMEVREHKSDIDQRNVKLEGQLKQYQLENQQKNKQLADLDDRLREAQEEVREKSLQLQQSEQIQRKLKVEVESQASHSQDTEMQLYTLRHRLESSLTENTELGQELKTAREEIQKIHYELTESRRELSITKREQDKQRKESQEATQKLQESEEYVKTLSEQLGQSKARGQQLESQTDVEMRKLIKEVDAMRNRHLAEIKGLTSKLASQSDTEVSQAARLEEMELKQTQLERQAEEAKKQAGHYGGQLESSQRLIEQLQSTIDSKNTELARMKGRVAGYETTCLVPAQQPLHTQYANQPAMSHTSQTMLTHSGNQSNLHTPAGYQSTEHGETLESLGHLGGNASSRDVKSSSYPESIEGTSVTGNLPSYHTAAPQSGGLPAQMGQSLVQPLGLDERMSQIQGNNERAVRNITGGQPAVGSDIPSQDDSIVSLLNRMQMHERNVQDILHGRHSTGINEGVTQNVGGAFTSVTDNMGGAIGAVNQNVGGALGAVNPSIGGTDTNRNVGGSHYGVNHPMGEATGGANQTSRGGFLQIVGGTNAGAIHQVGGVNQNASSQAVEGDCYHSGISSTANSSGRGTLMGSEGTEAIDPHQLADYLAGDPDSFQAMFKRLKDSYTDSNDPRTLDHTQDNVERLQPSDRGMMNAEYLNAQRQLIPTKDEHPSLTQEASAPHSGHTGYKPLKQGPDISTLSSISESESLKSALSKKSRGAGSMDSQQYTSSPKANRNPKKSVRIAASTQSKGGLTKFNSKNPSGTKTSKKGTASGSSGNNSKKSAKPVQSSSNQPAQKPSRFGALVAKGLANIEAAAHPSKRAQRSPGESEPSPNVSTAISHYAVDVDQSHGGSFLSMDQSLGDNITAQSGSSSEEPYRK